MIPLPVKSALTALLLPIALPLWLISEACKWVERKRKGERGRTVIGKT